jgi:uncharacterized small protein (DUF1192 family)
MSSGQHRDPPAGHLGIFALHSAAEVAQQMAMRAQEHTRSRTGRLPRGNSRAAAPGRLLVSRF